MNRQAYEELAAALDRLPNGFPRTPSNVEIPLLQKIFSAEEAALAGQLKSEPESVDAIAARAGQPTAAVRKQLMQMVRRGLVWLREVDGKRNFRLAPFVVGIYEAQLERIDHELAHLVEHYLADGGAAGIMGPQPALHRVLPSQGAIKSEWVLPYDEVRPILEEAHTFSNNDCICRVQQEQLGQRRCDFPLGFCLSFSSVKRAPEPGGISREEALDLLVQTEEIGLVHTVNNVAQGIGYVCNCCGCCCGILRGITDWGIEQSVAQANYLAVIDEEACSGCEVCVERCQVDAVTVSDDVAVVDRGKCIGCGLCVTGCPSEAATLERKPEDQIVHPPADFSAWEAARRTHRGLDA